MAYGLSEQEKDNPFIDNPSLLPIPVIASFSKEGKMVPIYISVEGIRIKIDNIKSHQIYAVNGDRFKCEITNGRYVQEIELFYHKNSNIWTLKRMQ